MFIDWKNKCCQNDDTTQGNLWIQCNPYQIANASFHRTRTIFKEMGLEPCPYFFPQIYMSPEIPLWNFNDSWQQIWILLQLRKEYVKAIYCHAACLTYVQSALCKMLGLMKHKVESRLPGELSIISRFVDGMTLMVESEEELKSILMKVKEESEKSWLQTQHSKN